MHIVLFLTSSCEVKACHFTVMHFQSILSLNSMIKSIKPLLPLTTVTGIYYCPGYLAIMITFLRVYTREVPAASSIQLIHQFTINAYALFEWLHIVLH
jgi:hypothetical protein